MRLAIAIAIGHMVVLFAAAAPPCVRVIHDRALAVSADGETVVLEYGRWTPANGNDGPGISLCGGSAVFKAVSGDGLSFVGNTVGGNLPGGCRWTDGVGLLPLDTTGRSLLIWDVAADGLTIVGEFTPLGETDEEAFRWDPVHGAQGLGCLPGASTSEARAISADGGTVVGESGDPRQAFRWTSAGGMQGLGFLPGSTESRATSTTSDGAVVFGYVNSPAEGFEWTEAGGMTSLGSFRPEDASPDGMHLVGWADHNSSYEATVWDPANGPRLIRELLESYDTGTADDWDRTIGRGISADGFTVVGTFPAGSPFLGWYVRLWPFEGYCEGDLDGDAEVTISDLAILLSAFGDSKEGDYNCDGDTDLSDLALLLANFGNSCP